MTLKLLYVFSLMRLVECCSVGHITAQMNVHAGREPDISQEVRYVRQ